MRVAKGVSPSETLNTTNNYTCLTDIGGGKARVYCISMSYRASARTASSVLILFGLVWLRTKCGNHHPNAVTTVVAPGPGATLFTCMVGEFATQLTHL